MFSTYARSKTGSKPLVGSKGKLLIQSCSDEPVADGRDDTTLCDAEDDV